MPRQRLLFLALAGAILALLVWSCWPIDTPIASPAAAPAGAHASSEPATATEKVAEVAMRRHAVHPKQEVLWVERMHASLGLPFHGALDADLKASIDAALSRGCESNTSPQAQARLEELLQSPSLTSRKRYHQKVHGIALLFGELEALAKDSYIRYGGDDFLRFYEECMNRYPDHYFACVGCDREGRQILLVVPAPPGSQIASAADAALALAQQGY